ncbi:MAG: hypothetical protein Q9181_003795 [Wetmoreana brouardii]
MEGAPAKATKPVISLIGYRWLSPLFIIAFLTMFTLHSYLTTFVFIDYAVDMFRHEGCSLSETTLRILLWALYGAFYACIFYLLPYSMAWVYYSFPDLFMTLSDPMKDDWDGGFWHREDLEAISDVKGQVNSTLASFNIDPRKLIMKLENHRQSTPEPHVYSNHNETVLCSFVTLTPLYELEAKGNSTSQNATNKTMAGQVPLQGSLRESKGLNEIDRAVYQSKTTKQSTYHEVKTPRLQHMGKKLLEAHPEAHSIRITVTLTRGVKVGKGMGQVAGVQKADSAPA